MTRVYLRGTAGGDFLLSARQGELCALIREYWGEGAFGEENATAAPSPSFAFTPPCFRLPEVRHRENHIFFIFISISISSRAEGSLSPY